MTLLIPTGSAVIAASITIQQWIKALRSVSFQIATTMRTELVTLTATLQASDGTRYVAQVRTLDPQLVTGMYVPGVPVGTYTLTVDLVNGNGQVEASASRRSVVVR